MTHYTHSYLLLTALAAGSAITSCKNIELYDGDIPQEIYFSEAEHFDFSTTQKISLDINYGSGIGANALVQIYEHFPDEGSSTEPLYQISTDEEGLIRNVIKLPTYIEEVWLVNHRFGMPEYVHCTIEDNTIRYVNEHAIQAESRAAVRGSVDNTDYSQYVQTLDANKKLYSIVSWDDRFGNIKKHPLVCTDHELAGDSYTTYVSNLQQTLWNGQTSKPSGLNNSKYALGGDIVNTKVLDSFIKDNGELAIVESATLNLVFMNEGAWNQNVLGYYYYPTDHVPAKASDVKKFVCLPNASKPAHHPYPSANSTTYYQSEQAPAYAGESISLLFEKADGTFTKNFPPGYTVGYFVIANGFTVGSTKGSINTNSTIYYSNEAWNSNSKKRYIALSLPNGAIVYGLEDSDGDQSYEDNLFIITGSPNEAIQNDEIPSIDPESHEIYNWEHISSVYAFEDQWPDGGDYDLNDVVICHKRGIYFEANSSKVSTVEDQFTLTTRSASYANGFAVQFNKNLISSITIKDNNDCDITSQIRHYEDPENNGNETYIIFDNIQTLHNGDHFTVTRTLRNQVKKTTLESMEINVNPFVISDFKESDYEAGSMVEIHIPNFGNRTCKATSAGSTGDTYFYVERKGNSYYPFAISLPWVEFDPSEERICIDISYPQFSSWATSLGKYSKDWYKYPNKK